MIPGTPDTMKAFGSLLGAILIDLPNASELIFSDCGTFFYYRMTDFYPSQILATMARPLYISWIQARSTTPPKRSDRSTPNF